MNPAAWDDIFLVHEYLLLVNVLLLAAGETTKCSRRSEMARDAKGGDGGSSEKCLLLLIARSAD